MRVYFQHVSAARRYAFRTILIAMLSAYVHAQTPATTPTPDSRGIGVQSASAGNSQAEQGVREAKPELVLQTGYNSMIGATRLVFSPDGRLLATATYRSSTIKLWETATGRELRDLSSGTQSVLAVAPVVAFSPDSRLIAAAAGDDTIKVWEVISGREVQTVTSGEGGVAS